MCCILFCVLLLSGLHWKSAWAEWIPWINITITKKPLSWLLGSPRLRIVMPSIYFCFWIANCTETSSIWLWLGQTFMHSGAMMVTRFSSTCWSVYYNFSRKYKLLTFSHLLLFRLYLSKHQANYYWLRGVVLRNSFLEESTIGLGFNDPSDLATVATCTYYA